jgi:hypothetical protein
MVIIWIVANDMVIIKVACIVVFFVRVVVPGVVRFVRVVVPGVVRFIKVLVSGVVFMNLGVNRMAVWDRTGVMDGRRHIRRCRNSRLLLRLGGVDRFRLGLRSGCSFRNRGRGRCSRILPRLVGLLGNHIAASRVLLQGAELLAGQRPGAIVARGA